CRREVGAANHPRAGAAGARIDRLPRLMQAGAGQQARQTTNENDMELKPFTAFFLFTTLASVHAMGGTAAEAMVKLDAAEQLWKRNAPAAYSFKFSYGGQVSWTACPDGFRAQVDGN